MRDILLLILVLGLKLNTQTVVDSTSIPLYNITNEGGFYVGENNNYYIVQQNGILKTLGGVKKYYVF